MVRRDHHFQPTMESRQGVGFPGSFGEEASSFALKQMSKAPRHPCPGVVSHMAKGVFDALGGHHEKVQGGVRVHLMIQKRGGNPSIYMEQDALVHK